MSLPHHLTDHQSLMYSALGHAISIPAAISGIGIERGSPSRMWKVYLDVKHERGRLWWDFVGGGLLAYGAQASSKRL